MADAGKSHLLIGQDSGSPARSANHRGAYILRLSWSAPSMHFRGQELRKLEEHKKRPKGCSAIEASATEVAQRPIFESTLKIDTGATSRLGL